MLPASKRCTKCSVDKPLPEFSKAPRGKHGHKSSCKQCDADRHAAQHVPKQRVPRRAPLDPSSSKACRKCGITKQLTEFSLSRKATATTNAVYRSDCKVCCSTRAKQWFADNPERAVANKRKFNLAKNYGLTVAEYDALLRQQGGVCAICGSSERMQRQGSLMRMPVDHCHKTGAVRGILCQACNRGLGFFRDDTVVMRRALSYLLRHQKKQDG
jgi:hypothetical protein